MLHLKDAVQSTQPSTASQPASQKQQYWQCVCKQLPTAAIPSPARDMLWRMHHRTFVCRTSQV